MGYDALSGQSVSSVLEALCTWLSRRRRYMIAHRRRVIPQKDGILSSELFKISTLIMFTSVRSKNFHRGTSFLFFSHRTNFTGINEAQTILQGC